MERKPISPEVRQQLIIAQRNEITEYHIYQRLAKKLKDKHNSQVLNAIAQDELKHYNIWKKYTGREVSPSRWDMFKFYWISRLFGITFGIKLMEKGEESARINYAEIAHEIPEAATISKEENDHEEELINILKEDKLEYIGSIVLGLNDALVEILGTLAGLTFALQNTKLVALAGIIAGIAGALSMSSSEYLSNKSEGNDAGAVKSALFTGLAYIVAVVFLVAPYLLFASPFTALLVAVLDSVFVVFVYSYYISIANDQPFRKRFLEMVVLSTVVGLISFGLGYLVRVAFGIEV
ncbi:VIT1/CCC1 transporter family protein [Sunxiuqinia elliptica]|uniref:Predicted Fe2+/Mn2+ transporter, VIT1/CCC1 family n=1 Tax=Sunxiuqinia elliptica TaxID=655355 RepID=A0A1I2EPR5_9BACT|nr:VIT1/CCC1 family protein [Sunxiuqinia elliptica]SFE95022.1 Predicted Fe2+/Mn2+ transporter, VIT1/CCC1 family [Sunxiuqinia elliptica]